VIEKTNDISFVVCCSLLVQLQVLNKDSPHLNEKYQKVLLLIIVKKEKTELSVFCEESLLLKKIRRKQVYRYSIQLPSRGSPLKNASPFTDRARGVPNQKPLAPDGFYNFLQKRSTGETKG
jgi:hypothetical protein